MHGGVFGALHPFPSQIVLAHGFMRSPAAPLGQAEIGGVGRQRSRGTAKANPKGTPAPYLVDREFTATRPDQLWVANMKQARTDEGWIYLVTVTDVFSRQVVGWAMNERMTANPAVGALNMAV
jgi:putative transposase